MPTSSSAWAATPPRIIPADSSGRSKRRRPVTPRSSRSIPRFTRTAAVADLYSPIRTGTDIAYLLGIIRYALANNRYHEDYVKIHTNAPLLINPDFKFEDGLFSGFDEAAGSYKRDTWAYQLDAKTGFAKTDPTLQDPNCVFQLLKKHVDRYTPEMVEKICGTPKDDVPEGRRGRDVDRQRRSASARSCTRSAGRSTRSACR